MMRLLTLSVGPGKDMDSKMATENIYIKETGYKGKGVFAARDFKKGDFLFRTTGQVRETQTEHSIQIGWAQHVDPNPPARYLNHSCEPSAGVKTNGHGYPDFVALRDIAKDEEITYDYAMTEFRHYPRATPELEFDLTCHCGARQCRGKFGYYSELKESLKQAYQGFISAYLLEADELAPQLK